MTEMLEAEAKREAIIARACMTCSKSIPCNCCMDWFAIMRLEAEINEAADKAAEERGL